MAPDKSQGLLLLHDLYQFITDYYNLDEIHTLCFELGINFEKLAGETRTRKARGLVIQLGLVDPEESYPSKYLELLEICAVGRKAFYPQLFENLDVEEQSQITREEGLAAQFCAGLDQFIKTTRPFHEKALSRFGLEQRVGMVAILLYQDFSSDLAWIETNGYREFFFQELQRGPWGIFPYDASRDMNVHLDFWTREMSCNDSFCGIVEWVSR